MQPVMQATRGGTGPARELQDRAVSPVLDLLTAGPARMRRNRAGVIAAGLEARAGGRRAMAVWPDLERPRVAVDLSDSAPAAWIAATFGVGGAPADGQPGARHMLLGPAARFTLRACAVLVGDTRGVAVAAAETALARRLERPRVALFSPSGAPTAKAPLFVFEGTAPEPVALVVTMPQPAQDPRLRMELEAVEAVRARVSSHPVVADGLPLAPGWTGDLDGRYMAVFPVDPLCGSTGAQGKSTAQSWLAGLQHATATETGWSAADTRRELGIVRDAWSALRPGSVDSAQRTAGTMLAGIEGLRYSSVAVHGDFWRGNLAVSGDRIRVYDWEWAREQGHPLFDLWTYELAELKSLTGGDPAVVGRGLDACRGRVAAAAERCGHPAALTDALLLPVLAELAIRNRRVSGLPSPPEVPYAELMDAGERRFATSGE